MPRKTWAVDDLADLKEDRQLSLLTYCEAFSASYGAAFSTWLRQDHPSPTSFLDGTQQGFARYQQAQEREDSGRQSVWAKAQQDAERAVLKERTPSWSVLRRLVYERDGGICWLCREPVAWEHYDLGHLQDRVAGGSDHHTNVVVMCNVCNRIWKPVHDTREAAERWAETWRSNGGVIGELATSGAPLFD